MRKVTTVKALCAARNAPFYELRGADSNLGLMLRRLSAPAAFGVHASYIYCGLLHDVHMFGRSFVYAKDDDIYVLHCQSYQNHQMSGLPDRWIGFLEMMGVARDRLIRVPITNSPAYRRAWVSSACHYRDSGGHYRIWIAGLHWMRQRIFSAIGGPQIHKHRRIFIGRADAKWRKLVNEPEIREVLTSYGFEFPALAEMSARAQIETISGADIVVAAAGAGAILTHFAPEHCAVILLAPVRVGTGPWGGMGAAAGLGQVYERIDGEPVESTHERANAFGTNEIADYPIDTAVLRNTVELAVKQMASGRKWDAIEL